MKDHPSTSPSPSQAEESDINGDGTTLPALSSVDSGSDANQDYLVHAFGQLGIQKRLPMAERMFASLERIFQHTFEIHRIDLGAHDWHARLQRADENSRRGIRDIEVLKWIRTVLDQLRLLDPEDLAESANVLANGSRDASWRLPFGQSGLLDFFLHVTTLEETEVDLLAPALRFIGNTCADSDVNREIAISSEYLPSIITRLQERELTAITISVIYNISRNHADLADCPENSVQTVVQLLQEQELDPSDLLLIVHTANAFLHQPRFQTQFVEQQLVDTLLELVFRSYTFETEDSEVEEELSVLRDSVNQTLSDISATSLFANGYPIDSALVGSLTQWLTSPREQIIICSCLVLGNLARSDQICLEMVGRLRLHERLLQVLQDHTDMQVAYAVLGFLRNLALPAENKTTIGSLESMQLISKFWSLDLNPQVQHASVSLLRQLLNNCITNVRWLLESLSPDEDSPAHEKTYLSLLLLLHGRTDDISTKVEIGRTIATICRCIASSSEGVPPESISAIPHRLYGMHADIARPLAMMITQNRFSIIRSEGWFALALMTRSREGSAAVSEVLQQMEVFGALVTTITGQSINGQSVSPTAERPNTSNTSSSGSGSGTRRPSSEPEGEMQARDRENALVLVNEMLRNTGDELSVIRRSILEDLMRGPQSPKGAQELMTRAQSENGGH
ncbi:MAG: hypothetical protein LQ338_004122 [Usnochroma carphineum]|nr:MAG: hypothetical protein LQ338_004122 [Usnochroma carphineum]